MSRSEALGLVYQQVNIAATERGLSPDLKMRHIDERGDGKVSDIYYPFFDHNLGGQVHVFYGTRRMDPVGVQVRLPGENKYVIGIYEPNQYELDQISNGYMTWEQLQEKVDQAMTDFYKVEAEEKNKLNYEDGLIVMSPALINYWAEGGMVQIPDRGDERLGKIAQEKWNLMREWGREFMWQVYLPAMMRGISHLYHQNFYPSDLVKPGMPVRTIKSHFAAVDFSQLINTSHPGWMRDWVVERDGWNCQFHGTVGMIQDGSQFTPEELIQLHEVAALYRKKGDRKKDWIGIDPTDIPASKRRTMRMPEGVFGRPYDMAVGNCERALMGYYPEISNMIKKLYLDRGMFDFHHVVPRGAFYTALLVADLMAKKYGLPPVSRDPQQAVLWARGVNIGWLISNENFHLFENIDLVNKTLYENLQEYDQIVNSKDNAVSLCPRDHRSLVHPDMEFSGQISALLTILETNGRTIGRIPKVSETELFAKFVAEWSERIMKRQLSENRTDFGNTMVNLHFGRRLVLGEGTTYWTPWYTDSLLDGVRIRNRRHIARLKADHKDEQLGQEAHAINGGRAALANSIATFEKDLMGSLTITRRTRKLEDFKDRFIGDGQAVGM